MKLSRKQVTLAAAVLLLMVAYIARNGRTLPSGKMTTPPAPDSGVDISSITPAVITGRPQVEVNTSKGKFTIELRPDVAPKTVVNFLSKWNSGYCNDKSFHRVEDWVVQGCDPAGDGTGGTTSLPTETSTETFLAGSVGVARKTTPRELSNDSQFFIVKRDSQFLDREYTYFGKVIAGLDTVRNLTAGDKIIATTVLTK